MIYPLFEPRDTSGHPPSRVELAWLVDGLASPFEFPLKVEEREACSDRNEPRLLTYWLASRLRRNRQARPIWL